MNGLRNRSRSSVRPGEHYESEVNKLEQSMNKRDELQKKELMKAIEDSNRSFEEIMQFLQCDTSSENSEDVES